MIKTLLKYTLFAIGASHAMSGTLLAGKVPVTAAEAKCEGTYWDKCGNWIFSCPFTLEESYYDVSEVSVDVAAQPSYLSNEQTDGPNCVKEVGGAIKASTKTSKNRGTSWDWSTAVGGKAGWDIKAVKAEVSLTLTHKFGGSTATLFEYGNEKSDNAPGCGSVHVYVRTRVRWGEEAHVNVTRKCDYKKYTECGDCQPGDTRSVTEGPVEVPVTCNWSDNKTNSVGIKWEANCPECPCKTPGKEEPAAPDWWTQPFEL